MSQNNFILDLIASLKKSQSKKQVQSDAKNLGDIKVPLTGVLDMAKTIKYIKNQLKGLSNTITIKPTINSKDVQNATKQTMANAQKVANSNKVKVSFDVDKQKLINQIKILGKNNSKLFTDKDMTSKYNQLLNSASVAKSTSELKALRSQLSAFRTELIATNKAGMTWSDKFKASINHFAQYFSGASFVYATINQLRKAWTEAKTLDDSLVNLQKVTDEIADRDALYKYFDKAMNKANELNVKVNSLIYAITEFKKLGWSLSDAELGGEWATILENVGDVDIDTAIGSIKTSIASFEEIGGYGDDQMDKKLEAYTDLINNMSNKYSIDAEGLAEAIRLSAGTLTEANTTIEQAATMFATANKYYNDPSYLGNTAKIGSLRMRATTGDEDAIEELSEMGEDVEEVTALTGKLREELIALTGVDIMVDNNTFKSYYDQLYEISQVIDELDDTTSARVLEMMFGKNRAAAGMSLLSGMQESETAYADAINSAGSSTEEYSKWMQSADAATQRFSNSLTEMYQSIINGNTVRDLANMGSAVLDFANSWGILEGAVKGYLALKIGTLITSGTMTFLTATKQVEQYGKALRMVNNIPDGNLAQRFSTLKNIATATSSLTTAQLKQVLSSKQLSQQDRIRILQLQGLTREMAKQKLAEMGLTQATNSQTAANKAQTVSTFSLKSAMVGLGKTMQSVFLSNPVGIALMAISVGVSAVTSAISKHNQKLEEMRDKAKEASEESANHVQSLLDLKEEFEEGTTSVEDLTTAFREQLRTMGYTETQIDNLISKYSTLADAIDGATREALENAKTDAYADMSTSGKALVAKAKGNTNVSTYYSQNKELSEQIRKMLIDSPATLDGGVFRMDKNASAEDIYEYYLTLKEISQLIQETATETGDDSLLSGDSLNSTPYYQVSEALNTLSESAELYGDAIGRLHSADAQLELADYLKTNDIDSKEAFDSYINGIKNSTQYSEEYKQVLLGVANDAFPQFSSAVEKAKDTVDDFNSKVSDLSISSTIDNLNTRLKPTFDALKDAYQSIFVSDDGEIKFTLDDVDISTFESIKSGIDELDEIEGIEIDYSAFDDFVKVLSDTSSTSDEVQGQFDKLATSIVYSSDCTEMSADNFDLLCKSLYEMGLTNAKEVLTNIKNAQEELKASGIDLKNVTGEQAQAFLNEAEASDIAKEYLRMYMIQKQLDKPLNTSADVEALEGLCNSLGVTGEMLKWVASLKSALGAVDAGAPIQAFQSQIDTANQKIAELAATGGSFKFDFDSNVTSPSKDSSSKDKSNKPSEVTKPFDWIENYLESFARKTEKIMNRISDYLSFKKNLSTIKSAIKAIRTELSANQQALAEYEKQMNAVGLSQTYIDKIKNGELNIETIIGYETDGNKDANAQLIEKIEKYQDLYDKYTDIEDTIEDLRETEKEWLVKNLEYVNEYYQKLADIKNLSIDKRQDIIDLKEATGKRVTTSDYKKLVSNNEAYIKSLKTTYKKTNAEFNKLVKNGTIEKDSAEWFEWKENLADLNSEIVQAQINTAEWKDEINQIKIDGYTSSLDRLQAKYEKLNTTISRKEKSNIVASKSDYNKVIKNLNQQITKNEKLLALYKKLQSETQKNSEKWREYQGLIEDTESSVENLRDSIIETAEKMAGVIAELRDKQLEDNQNAESLLDAKYDNATSASERNKNLDEQDKIAKSNFETNQKASKDYTTSLNNLGTQLSKIISDANSEKNKDVLSQLKGYEFGKEIDLSKITDEKLLAVAAEYNKTLENQKQAFIDAGLSEQEYIKALRESASQRIQNIIDEADALDVLNQAMKAQIKSKMDLNKTQGYNISDMEYENYIGEVSNGINLLNDAYNEALEQFNNNLKAGVYDDNEELYLKDKANIENLKASIYEAYAENESMLDEIMQSRIDALNEEKEAIQKLYDLQQRRYKLEEAQHNLEKAKQKTNLVYNGTEFVHQEDTNELKEAEKALEEAQHSELINKIDDWIEAMEDAKEDINLYDAEGKSLGSTEDIIKAAREIGDNLLDGLEKILAENGYAYSNGEITKVQAFADGGVVGKPSDKKFDEIAQALNEDHLVAVKRNEMVLTEVQGNELYKKLVDTPVPMPILDLKPVIPDNLVRVNTTPISIDMSGMQFHEVQNMDEITGEIQKMADKAGRMIYHELGKRRM